MRNSPAGVMAAGAHGVARPNTLLDTQPPAPAEAVEGSPSPTGLPPDRQMEVQSELENPRLPSGLQGRRNGGEVLQEQWLLRDGAGEENV